MSHKEGSSKRLTSMEWTEAEAKWATGEFTLENLSAEFGVRPETLSRRFTKRGIKKGSTAIHREVHEAYVEAVRSRADITAEKIHSRREKFDSWGATIGGLIMKEVATANREGVAVAIREANIKTLAKAAQGLQAAWALSKDALNMEAFDDGSDDLPELAFTQLTEDQIERIREAQTTEDEVLVDDGLGLDDDLEELEEELED